MAQTALQINKLSVTLDTKRGPLKVLDELSFEVYEREIFGLVGESGCGKSMTALALMGLLPRNARVDAKDLDLRVF
jgi:ABC-type dipeptide/oligopeptide/nickel transport system ATPase component